MHTSFVGDLQTSNCGQVDSQNDEKQTGMNQKLLKLHLERLIEMTEIATAH